MASSHQSEPANAPVGPGRQRTGDTPPTQAPVIDAAIGLAAFREASTLARYLALFAERYGDLPARLDDAAVATDGLVFQVHDMHGAAATLGLARVARAAAALEDRAREGGTDLHERRRRLAADLRDTLSAIAAFPARPAATGPDQGASA